MNRYGKFALFLTLLLVGCVATFPASIDRSLLEGAWTSNGASFEFAVREHTTLYEFDMQEHPYKIDGDILVVDFEDPTLGIQRKRINRLTKDELELSDAGSKNSTLYRHVP